ncbi:hypothetical protein CsSME_00012958 [Camellia sinensis var. sinensis]
MFTWVLHFQQLRELFTAHAPYTKLRMKMLSRSFYHLLSLSVFNWQLRFPSGLAVVSQFWKDLNICFGLIRMRTKKDSSFHYLLGRASSAMMLKCR